MIFFILRDISIRRQAESYLFFFYFEERKQSYNVAQSNIILPTLSHKPLLHFEEKKLKRAKANEERRERENRGGGGWQSADEEQWGGGVRAQFTEAALNQPITVKENISWCVSSPHEEERMKGEEGECI